jgi:parvulin-like peptidyl-prolyl isomerase
LLPLLQLSNKDSQTLRKIYNLYFFTQNFNTEINDPKTFEQLKSTGDMRLIKNKAVLDSIASYYQLISVVKTFRDEIQSQLQLTYNLSFKIFDQYSFDNNRNLPAPFITNDAVVIKEYTNKLYQLMKSYIDFRRFLKMIKSKSVNLNQLIKKEYHLENE